MKTKRKLLKGTGISFSWKRLLGLTKLRLKIARKLGIPTTRKGWEYKIGKSVLNIFFRKSKTKRKSKSI
ncbi:MAG: hypothetical protein Q4C68_07785 [Moraxella sp.]|nr:hypothetical protein [Moraxella sp.]